MDKSLAPEKILRAHLTILVSKVNFLAGLYVTIKKKEKLKVVLAKVEEKLSFVVGHFHYDMLSPSVSIIGHCLAIIS